MKVTPDVIRYEFIGTEAEVHVQLKPGIFGVRVKIMPPDAVFPDKIQIVEAIPPEEEKTEDTLEAKEEETEEKSEEKGETE